MHLRPSSVKTTNRIVGIIGRPVAPPQRRLSPHLLLLHRRPRPTPTTSSYELLTLGGVCSRRHIHIPNILLPPVVFTGLVLALYAWKSFVMITLQNKIIYNPYMPPSARRDKIEDYKSRLYGIEWKEVHMKSIDRTDLALAVASVASGPGNEAVPVQHNNNSNSNNDSKDVAYHVYILYLQGNASSLPPRLPDHSWILHKLRTSFHDRLAPTAPKVRFTHVALSYRGYWTSSGRPSEIGINHDTRAAIDWIAQLHSNTYPPASSSSSSSNTTKPLVFIWGQSIGAGFATNLAATAPTRPAPPTALILETPFLSIKEMLAALYPEKWLPYKYLYPFLRNFLDSARNLDAIAAAANAQQQPPPKVFILEAGRDELVPAWHPEKLRARCEELGIPVEKKVVARAFHNDAMMVGGRAVVAEFIMRHTAEVMLRES